MRIADMDAAGIDIQVLSQAAPGPETLRGEEAIRLAKESNDTMAAAVEAHPNRFAAFACLPMSEPAAAAAELERAVKELGFVGTLINGHVGAVQRIRETFNGNPETLATLEVRWEDPKNAQAEYDHVLLATGKVADGAFNTTIMHEYTAAPFGTRMRSHFLLPPQAPEAAIKALYEHNKQEMPNCAKFLPALYRSEVGE
jgi:hypothetical protein